MTLTGLGLPYEAQSLSEICIILSDYTCENTTTVGKILTPKQQMETWRWITGLFTFWYGG